MKAVEIYKMVDDCYALALEADIVLRMDEDDNTFNVVFERKQIATFYTVIETKAFLEGFLASQKAIAGWI